MLTEFNELRERVEETAGRFTSAEQDRHRQSASLMDILGRLEQKFVA